MHINTEACANVKGHYCQIQDVLNWYYDDIPLADGDELHCNFIHKDWSFDFYEYDDFDETSSLHQNVGERMNDREVAAGFPT